MEKTLKQKVAVVAAIGIAAIAISGVKSCFVREHVRVYEDEHADVNEHVNAHAQVHDTADDESVDAFDGNPRNILGRLWFDKLPQKRSDEFDLWIFFGGGIGLEDKGSYFRSTFDLFELERNKDRLDVVFLHDKKKAQTKFTVKACDEKPPFDLCLVLDTPLKGVTKLYSWGDDDDMDRFVPWASAWKRSANERTRAGK
jgi:hypothetical protein